MIMKSWFTKKKIIFGVIVLLVVGFFFFRGKGKEGANIQSEAVRSQNLKQTVLATGQVVSTTDLSLSFKASGVVNRVNVKVGDKVKAGQILANLDQKDEAARLTQARGAYQQAQANYQKVLDGTSSEEVRVSQVAVDNAKNSLDSSTKQQKVLVDNAYKALLNSSIAADQATGNTGNVTVTVTGVYNSEEQGKYNIGIYATGSGLRFQYSGLETGDGVVSTSPQPLGKRGLYLQFSSTSVSTSESWSISIPNTQASNYVTNYNIYQAALETQKTTVSAAENALATAQANLELKKASARPADIAVAQAQVTSALGQVQAAEAALENATLRAPADGTVTKVDIKVGELAQSLKEVMVLQDVGSLHVEANISEANIVPVKTGQEVEMTFDSLGLDRKFMGKVQEVDPASTLVSGVVNYKVTVGLDKVEEVKPGMTANISILVAQKEKVIAVPLRAVISKDGKKVVRVINDPKKKTFDEKEVTTGLEADGGLVEITSGLSENQEVVTLIKQ
jgi:HlyD family secretion protein